MRKHVPPRDELLLVLGRARPQGRSVSSGFQERRSNAADVQTLLPHIVLSLSVAIKDEYALLHARRGIGAIPATDEALLVVFRVMLDAQSLSLQLATIHHRGWRSRICVLDTI